MAEFLNGLGDVGVYILGVKSWMHDTGAAILSINDEYLETVAISESRLDRNTHSFAYPILSIQYCMESFNISSLSDIDLICIDAECESWPDMGSQYGLKSAFATQSRQHGRNDRLGYILEQTIKFDNKKVFFCRHIDAHAASAFYVSGFEEAAILIMDESGMGIFKGSGRHLETIYKFGYSGPLYIDHKLMVERHTGSRTPASIYQRITNKLGFGMFGAGKTMALAAFGDTVHRRDILQSPTPERTDRLIDYSMIKEELESLPAYNKNTSTEGILSENWINLARQGQEILEHDMLRLAALAKEKTGLDKLCLAGGVALSCVINRKIHDSGLFSEIFIQPAASDEGIALGCALYGHHMVLGGTTRKIMDKAYLGREYDPSQVPAVLDAWNIPYRLSNDGEVAQLISEGKVIARVFGRSEFGPRALGNRSILADPRHPDMMRRINAEIKHREPFRPFAPSCTAEHVGSFFDMPVEGPFMIMAASVLPAYRCKLPAITHVDGSSRVQTVRKDQNPRYHNLLSEFEKITGFPILLNTSFNDNGSPIAENYHDAILEFINTGVDHLYIEGYLCSKPENPKTTRNSLSEHITRNIEHKKNMAISDHCNIAMALKIATNLDGYQKKLADILETDKDMPMDVTQDSTDSFGV